MKDLERIFYLIHRGESANAGQWARKLAEAAFSKHDHLRPFEVCR
jgi:hypothetical protein